MIHGSPTGCRRAGQDFCGEGLVCLILSGTSEWRTEMFSTQKKAGIPKFASQILWSSCFLSIGWLRISVLLPQPL